MGDKFLVYGRSSCSFCVNACRILRESRKQYTFFDLESDRRFLDEAKSFYGYETVPLVLRICSKTNVASFLGGCDSLEEFLNAE